MNGQQWHQHVFGIATAAGLVGEEDREWKPGHWLEAGWLSELAEHPQLLRSALEPLPHGEEIANRALIMLSKSVHVSHAGQRAQADAPADWADKMVVSLEPVYAAIYGGGATVGPLRIEDASPDDLAVLMSAELEEALFAAFEQEDGEQWPTVLHEPLYRLLGGSVVSVWICLIPFLRALRDARLRGVVEALEQLPNALDTTLYPVRSVSLGRWFLKSSP